MAPASGVNIPAQHMNNDELIKFNPILAEAVAEAEKGIYWAGAGDHLRELVASSVRTGIPADRIYAIIKTGRILTANNIKMLTEADIKEWQDARHEYDRLAGTKKTPMAKDNEAMAKAKTYELTIEVTVQNEQQAIELARKVYEENPAAEPVDDSPEEPRPIPPEAFIDDIQAALMQLVEANPLLERAGIEVTRLSASEGSGDE
jgi:hypothetical protein